MIAPLILAASLHMLAAAPAPPPPPGTLSLGSGISRSDLQRHDLAAAGYEMVQVRVGFDPGAEAAGHSHPGEEIVYVLEGALEYRLEGRPPVTIAAGEILFIPDGAIHAVRNAGPGRASELATYIVRKGEPLVTLASSD